MSSKQYYEVEVTWPNLRNRLDRVGRGALGLKSREGSGWGVLQAGAIATTRDPRR